MSATQNFLIDFHGATSPRGDLTSKRRLGSSERYVDFNLWPMTGDLHGTIYVDEINARPELAGLGTQALKLLCRLADRHHVAIELWADEAWIVEWYAKAGFVVQIDAKIRRMRREPRRSAHKEKDQLP